MSAPALPRPTFRPHTLLDRIALGAATCGGVYGAGLARYLFESRPQNFLYFGTWPGLLLLAVGCGGAMLAVSKLTRAHNRTPAAHSPFAPLALLFPVASLFSPEVNLLRAQTLLLGALALFVLLSFFTPEIAASGSSRDAVSPAPRLSGGLLPCVLFLLLFLLYLRTLAPAVGEADTFEFQVGIARLGIAHGSGYPLLMLLGKVFTLLPVGGTLAFRANLTSAFFGALAGVGVERLARRLGASPLSALLAGLAFGVSPTLWSRAVEVEAYPLNAAFVAALLYLCVELADRPASNLPSPTSNLYLLAFLFGLSLTNHLTTLLLAPACLAAALLATRNSQLAIRNSQFAIRNSQFATRNSQLAIAMLAFLLGLSVYLYLPLRWPAVNQGEPLSFAQFAHILSGGEAKGAFNPALPFTDVTRYAIVFRKIVGEYGWAGSALALVGVFAFALRQASPQALRRWPVALILILAYAGYGYFALGFNVPDPDFSAFLIPMHLIAAVLMGVGLQAILNSHFLIPNSPLAIRHSSFAIPQSRFPSNLVECLVLCVFCLLSLHSLWLTLPRVDKSRAWDQYRLGTSILRQPLAPGATILADSQKIAPLYYLQVAEGLRPDLDVVVLPDEASYRAALEERLAAGRTVYLGRYLPGLGSAYSLRSVGPLAEVSAQPFTTSPTIAHPLSATLAANIRLLGYDADQTTLSAPEAVGLTLFWRADEPVTASEVVGLRLVDGTGHVAWQNSGSVPVSGLYPTNAWRPGEVLSDFHSIRIDATLAPGAYRLEVGLFPPFPVPAPQAAPAVDSGWVGVAPLTILPAAESPQPAHPLRARFGTQWLMGYQLPESAAPGSHLTLTLYWLRTTQAETVTAFGEARSLAAWPVGQLVPQVYRFTAPAAGDRFEVVVDTGEAARCGWLAPATTSCRLRPIQLAGEAVVAGAINFDNQILLARSSIDTPVVAPGGQAEVTLYWQSLQTLTEDYTVFVHLLGPDGLVHGQVDAWPVSGTLATSRWRPGEKIEDHYRVSVPGDAPPGEYSVEVGFYLLATLERLPVLNADGAPVDDKALIAGLSVR